MVRLFKAVKPLSLPSSHLCGLPAMRHTGPDRVREYAGSPRVFTGSTGFIWNYADRDVARRETLFGSLDSDARASQITPGLLPQRGGLV
jgi:hypothetical protein